MSLFKSSFVLALLFTLSFQELSPFLVNAQNPAPANVGARVDQGGKAQTGDSEKNAPQPSLQSTWQWFLQQAAKGDHQQAQEQQQRERSGEQRGRRGRRRPPEQTEAEQLLGDLIIDADEALVQGNIIIYEGYVDARYGELHVQADRAIYNKTTDDLTVEGNVIFDQGLGHRIAARRAEVSLDTRKGVFFDVTGFTNQTQDGAYLYFKAERAEKTGPDSYTLYNAEVTSCEQAIPQWSFKTSRTVIKLDDRAWLRNAMLKIKGIPAIMLPWASLSIDRRERKSGFLFPTTGSSNQKGRTISIPYYQVLGRSADLTVRTEIFTRRGIGEAIEFRARSDEQSAFSLGGFFVQDRLFGEPGPDQGGSSFFVEGLQYLPHGFVAGADVSITSNLAFRQVFSEDFNEITNPEERSSLYVNNNFKNYIFNFLAQSRDATLLATDGEFNSSINIRQLPSFEFNSLNRQIKDLPVYFSFNTAVDGVRRKESVDEKVTFITPSVVQRFDLQPKLTFRLPALDDWTFTPSVSFRDTFYSNSIDPTVRPFNPRFFALTPDDPRLDPNGPLFDPNIKLFDLNRFSRITSQSIFRNYFEFALDIRPPAVGRAFEFGDGASSIKHVIEPMITYRLIRGIDNFARIPRFDERDVVANTNEIEYALVNRLFQTRRKKKETGQSPQPHEILSVKISQKYFFDPTFGGALVAGQRNQFYPINTLSGFTFGSFPRRFSPINLNLRLRPLSSFYGDFRSDYDQRVGKFRNVIVSAGFSKRWLSIAQSWFYSRRIEFMNGLVEPGTFPGNQYITSFSIGDIQKGLYGGTSLYFDFVDRGPGARRNRLLTSSNYIGYSGKCCGAEIAFQTINTGLRTETRFAVSFTLAGIGSFGTDKQRVKARQRTFTVEGRGAGRRGLRQ